MKLIFNPRLFPLKLLLILQILILVLMVVFLLFQMPHPGRVVRLTRCEGVPGFPALLVAALSSQGSPWFPEYYVYEDYREYGQTQYCCEVHILNEAGDQDLHLVRGFGVTEEQSVHQAAYCALTRYCEHCDYLRAPTSVFRHFPAAREAPEGFPVSVYRSAQYEQDPSYRCLVDLVQALDRQANQWYHQCLASRVRHWDMLMRLRPYVLSGHLPEELLYPTEPTLPSCIALPSVGGVVPRRGRRLPPIVERGLFQSPYAPQPYWERSFHTSSVTLPEDFGGYF